MLLRMKLKKPSVKKARQYHPDVNKDNPKEAEAKFKEANEAYEVLSDETKKAQYDQFGHDAFKQGGGAGGPEVSKAALAVSAVKPAVSVIFSAISLAVCLGGGRQQQGPQKGNDLREDIDISFEDAAFGKSMDIEVHRHEECDHCHGTGGEPGSRVDTCPNCQGGSGQETVIQNTPFGRMQSVRTCSRCHGSGKIIEKPCSKCRGSGEMLAKRKISIKIPAGVDSGSRLRVANEGGEPGILGGPKGDLYVYIFVRPHKEFERNGNDVISRVNISFAQAALGASIQVNTLDGKVELKIPEGTQTGTAFRVKGKGIPYLRNPKQRGNQHIVVNVQTPKKLTDTQRELLLRFANESNEDVNNLQVSKSLFDKIKDCLTK
nr:molecular chaperone DnaJ [Veillonella denticariosi]